MPIEIRARVAQLLHEEALPMLATWLHSKADISNLKHRRVEIIYDEPADRLKTMKYET